MQFDINTDLGEGYGRWSLGDDAAMMEIVSSANVACGMHAGDAVIMDRCAELAARHGVALGAHVGLPDLWGFGRVSMDIDAKVMGRLAAYQIGALAAIAAERGIKVSHASGHGALGMIERERPEVMTEIFRAFHAFDPGILLAVPVHSPGETCANALGMRRIGKIFADRAIDDSGQLVSRKLPGAVLTDLGAIRARLEQFLETGALLSVTGKAVMMDARCILIHSDTNGAVAIARTVREAIEAKGHEVTPLDRLSSI